MINQSLKPWLTDKSNSQVIAADAATKDDIKLHTIQCKAEKKQENYLFISEFCTFTVNFTNT